MYASVPVLILMYFYFHVETFFVLKYPLRKGPLCLLFLHEHKQCGHSLECLAKVFLMHINICFFVEKLEKYPSVLICL